MSLASVVRNSVKIANKVTTPLQSRVYLIRRKDQPTNAYGSFTPNPAAAIPLLAAVERKNRRVTTPSGDVAQSTITITFVDTALLLSVTDNQGLSLEDQLFLPDPNAVNGMVSQPMLAFGGYIDGLTSLPFASEIYI